MTTRTKVMIYTILIITLFMIAPAFIFTDFNLVLMWTWPFIFLGAGFAVMTVWIYSKIFNK